MRERRFSQKQKPRQLFLVICEGDTEKEYIEHLKFEYRLPITIKTKVSGNRINSRLVAQYIKELDVNIGDACEVFFVYDADVREVVAKLNSLPGTLLLSNPCIEFWFLLHCKNWRRPIEAAEAVRMLKGSHSVWNSYAKGILSDAQNNFLKANRGDAMTRAQHLPYNANPSSNIHEFIQLLENAKKR